MRYLTYWTLNIKRICMWSFGGNRRSENYLVQYFSDETKTKFCILKQICSRSYINKTTLVCSKKIFRQATDTNVYEQEKTKNQQNKQTSVLDEEKFSLK